MTKQKGAQKSGTNARALMPAETRNRITLSFQLDVAKDNVEFFIAVKEWLAGQRSWKRYMMDGLRLFYDLKNGSTAVLLELFPNIREMLGQGCNDDLKSELAELRRILLEREIPPTGTAIMQPLTTGKQLSSKQLTAPTFAEDEDDVLPIATKAAQSNSSMNFVNALQNLH
jgi:hypothetical protein